MMSTTHLMISLLVATPLVFVAPESTLAILVGASLGGTSPDIDLLFGKHRKTTHFPKYGVLFALFGFVLFGLGVPYGPAFAAFGIAFWLHPWCDIFGAGVELRPWKRTNTRAVYDHVDEEWKHANYIVGYDGSPEDLALTTALLPLLAIYSQEYWVYLAAVVGGIGVVYSFSRKLLPELLHWLLENVPQLRPILGFFENHEETKRR